MAFVIIGFDWGASGGNLGSWAVGFLIIAGGILFTYITFAATMIFLDMADDIRAIRHKLDKQ